MWYPTQNLCPIGSAVLIDVYWIQKDKQTNRHPDWQAYYIYTAYTDES